MTQLVTISFMQGFVFALLVYFTGYAVHLFDYIHWR
jgi:hypothetical protein